MTSSRGSLWTSLGLLVVILAVVVQGRKYPRGDRLGGHRSDLQTGYFGGLII